MMAVLLAVLGWAAFAWIYQIKVGMGVAGITHPVMWGVYITNFVFWVGIAHSGTLISAILYLMRSGWRTTINRTAEAMTIFAVMTAGLFPLIHLGRVWYFYFLAPYPNQRLLWPNFRSPLIWDFFAIGPPPPGRLRLGGSESRRKPARSFPHSSQSHPISSHIHGF